MGETFQERVQNSPVRSSGIKGFFTGKQEKNTEVTKLLAKEDGKSGDKLSRSRSNDELMGVLPSKVLVRFEYFLRGFFNKYDKDRSGSIDKQELSNLIRDMNDSVKPDLLEQLFSAFDADNDGQISFDEFVSGAAQLVIAKGDLVDVWGSGGGGGLGGGSGGRKRRRRRRPVPQPAHQLGLEAPEVALEVLLRKVAHKPHLCHSSYCRWNVV
uniref:EF-hand domain-containing protein n=2 Tax=Heterosigma akashiwo TaxID=2829 RepID=A0A7S4D6L6_HETAK|mmetsp:Transcript_13750/g.21589  ORF Transcript_13750/g.21589 Transcript_13750/m.21589 type:complete len:212 (+) Transcript_13750:202-837(+)